MALNLKTLSTRAISALFFVIILVGCITYSYISFLLLFFAVSMIALHEYYKLAALLNAQPFRVLGYMAAFLIFVSFSAQAVALYYAPGQSIYSAIAAEIGRICLVLLVLFPLLFLMKAMFSKSATNLADAMHTLLGFFYAVFPFALLTTIPSLSVLGVIFLIWSNDTLAYLGGSLFGKHKMFERISPGKTWEGTVIGALGAVGVAFLLNLYHVYESDLIWPVIAVLVATFGTIGDLVESMLKRQAGVKDSGRIMPGHGGALDRFDSLIFVTPFVYVLLYLLDLL